MTRTAAKIVFFLLICANAVMAQQTAERIKPSALNGDYKKTEILIGFSSQFHSYEQKTFFPYFEAGIAKSVHLESKLGTVSAGLYLAEEIHPGNDPVFGTKFGFYAHYLLDVGGTLVYYTDWDQGSLKLRPEAGFGYGPFRLNAGFNIPLAGNKKFELIRRNGLQLTVQYFLPLKAKPIHPEDCNN